MKNDQTNALNPQELLGELRVLLAEAQAMISHSVPEPAAGAFDSLGARFSAARERVTGACSEAREKIVARAKSTDHAIRENPYQALAIALGVGLLAGVVLGQRNR